MPNAFDTVVIGGGPAGSVTALLLAGLGWRTALVEYGPRYRTKACGHCLNRRAYRMLRGLGLLEDVQRLAAGPTRHLRVHIEHRPPLRIPLLAGRDQDAGLLIERRRFDQLLIDRAAAAGAQVIQPASARIGTMSTRHTTVEVVSEGSRQRLRCRLLVGADGLGSAVARAAGLNRAASVGRKFGFAFDLDCSSAEVIPRDTVEMFVVNGGYLGVVNHGRGKLHVAGLIARRPGIERNPYAFIESVAGRFERLQQTALNRLDRRHCSRLLAAGPMPWRPWTVANDRVALVGDAAGYVEPFTGEGMSCALESAEALADALADQSPGAWTAVTARRYRRAWRDRVGRRQRICRMLAMALDRPGVRAAVFHFACGHPKMMRGLVRRVVTP